MLWRGLLPEHEIEDSATLGTRIPRLSYTDLTGNMVIYFVPDSNGSILEGQRIFNWAAYIPIPQAELPVFMIDRKGRPHKGTIPPGGVRIEEEERLKRKQELVA